MTGAGATTDNAIVVKSLRGRRFVAGCAVLGVLGLALLPSEHVHGRRSEDGQHADVVHRHFQPHDSHHPVTTGVGVDDHGDEDAQWLTQAFVAPKAESSVHPVTQLLADDLPLLQSQETSRRIVPSTYVSVHDPPWAASNGLRAPPSPLV